MEKLIIKPSIHVSGNNIWCSPEGYVRLKESLEKINELKEKNTELREKLVSKSVDIGIEFVNEREQLKKEIENLKCELLSMNDTCPKCGCTEFLCGHNKR